MTPSPALSALIERGSQRGLSYPERVQLLSLTAEECEGGLHESIRKSMHFLLEEQMLSGSVVSGIGAAIASGLPRDAKADAKRAADAVTARKPAVPVTAQQREDAIRSVAKDAFAEHATLRGIFPDANSFAAYCVADDQGRVHIHGGQGHKTFQLATK